MKPDLKIEEIFNNALKLTSNERKEYLDSVLNDAPEIITRIESMVKDFGEASRFFEELHVRLTDLPNYEGEQLGVYRLTKLIGEGGMSKVYLAERTDGLYSEKVAIKILRSFGEVQKDHTRERQILADLTHPYIANIFNAGYTRNNEPYIVMEFIEGIAIDRYCQTEALTLQSMLNLFLKVCEAVQYAHKNLIIHRDIKPANILIDNNSNPKLLDFGIALLQSDNNTEARQQMTLNYAAPEQFDSRHQANAATDIYQLGLVLYKMLTNRHAYDLKDKTIEQCQNIIRKEDPLPLESKQFDSKQIGRDVRAILQKALQKDPNNRYDSVQSMLNDIKAALRDYPLSIAPTSRWVNSKKFLKRNSKAVTAFSITLISLIIFGLSYTIEVTRQKNIAVIEKKKANEVKNYLTDILRASDPTSVDPDTVTLNTVLLQASEKIKSSYDNQPVIKHDLIALLVDIFTIRGKNKETQDLLTYQTEILNSASAVQKATHYVNRANYQPLYKQNTKLEEIKSLVDSAFAFSGQIQEPGRFRIKAKGYNGLARIYENNQELKKADSLYRMAILEYKKTDLDDQQMLTYLGNLAQSKINLQNYDLAIQLYDSVISYGTSILPPDHPFIYTHYNNLGSAYNNLEKYDSALYFFKTAYEAHSDRLNADHPMLIMERNNLAALYLKTERPEEAKESYRYVLKNAPKAFGENHILVAFAATGLGRILTTEEKYNEAEKLIERALQILPEKTWYHGLSQSALAVIYQFTDRTSYAKKLHAEAYEKVRAARGDQDIYTKRVLQEKRKFEDR